MAWLTAKADIINYFLVIQFILVKHVRFFLCGKYYLLNNLFYQMVLLLLLKSTTYVGLLELIYFNTDFSSPAVRLATLEKVNSMLDHLLN